MAESVTRHAQISQGTPVNLACGIDTLDIGFYVYWDSRWDELLRLFDERKLKAQGTDGLLIEVSPMRSHMFLPGGKAPNYRYHVVYPEYHCFIAISSKPKNSPNVFVSFTSEALHWELSERELIDMVRQDIEAMGGKVESHKISRCDLYSDFKIPGGLSLGFIQNHMVGRNDKTYQFMQGNDLETFYVGGKRSDIKIRIYDKGKEVKKSGSEERWLALWFIDDHQDVWRVEAQIRRPILKQFIIDTIDDLLKKKADLWRYVTEDWFSLRNQDNENPSRRTVHELWKKVQDCSEIFGSQVGAKRRYVKRKRGYIDWYVKRIAALYRACAAILKIHDPKSCLQKVGKRVLFFLDRPDFLETVKRKSIELGVRTAEKKKAPLSTTI